MMSLPQSRIGPLLDADCVGRAGNPLCGDVVTVYLRLKGDRVEAARFEARGCAALLAAAHALSDAVEGRTMMEALRVDVGSLVGRIPEYPRSATACANLAREALHRALKA